MAPTVIPMSLLPSPPPPAVPLFPPGLTLASSLPTEAADTSTPPDQPDVPADPPGADAVAADEDGGDKLSGCDGSSMGGTRGEEGAASPLAAAAGARAALGAGAGAGMGAGPGAGGKLAKLGNGMP